LTAYTHYAIIGGIQGQVKDLQAMNDHYPREGAELEYLRERCDDLEREVMRQEDRIKDISAGVNAMLHAAEAQDKATGGQTVSLSFVSSWIRQIVKEVEL